MPRAALQHLIERYLHAYNHFDIEGMLALLAPDVHFENYSGDTLTASAEGIEAFRALAEQSGRLFSEREQRLTGLHIGQHSAVADIAYRGRLAVDVDGGPEAGSWIELSGTTEFSFADGRVTRIVDRSR